MVLTHALPDKTPFKAFWGCKPDILHFCKFGTTCWVLQQDTNVHKLMHKSHPCCFIGFFEESCTYWLYDPATGQIITSRIVIFKRTSNHLEGEISNPPPLVVEGEQPTTEQPPEVPDPPNMPITLAPAPVTPVQKLSNLVTPPGAAVKPSPSQIPPAPRFQAHATSALALKDLAAANSAATVELSLTEAQAQLDWPEWKATMDWEIAQLQCLSTYTLTACPPDRKSIGCKWVFHIKGNTAGCIIKYKAHLIAQGFLQVPGREIPGRSRYLAMTKTRRLKGCFPRAG
ncbi:hypothetical protein NUW54_g557 [Trametes sanguinea]|uniref:Uncharacterized protein n=2 Tax=Trametes sanguinea TaxID=158606 RepID=A0ACC1Q8U9_9APHY|nr:hypothetical protein NUW54_g1440 [Trametes sanguinea]KAJ3017548.1 hypothetical protein NUW54_g557 [Trametes sanguinea]